MRPDRIEGRSKQAEEVSFVLFVMERTTHAIFVLTQKIDDTINDFALGHVWTFGCTSAMSAKCGKRTSKARHEFAPCLEPKLVRLHGAGHGIGSARPRQSSRLATGRTHSPFAAPWGHPNTDNRQPCRSHRDISSPSHDQRYISGRTTLFGLGQS